jgi:hypothetical protein
MTTPNDVYNSFTCIWAGIIASIFILSYVYDEEQVIVLDRFLKLYFFIMNQII